MNETKEETEQKHAIWRQVQQYMHCGGMIIIVTKEKDASLNFFINKSNNVNDAEAIGIAAYVQSALIVKSTKGEDRDGP